MVVIVDIVDQNRVLVDGLKAFPRVVYPLRRLTLTRLKVPGVLRGSRTGTLTKLVKSYSLDDKWKATSAFKKMDRFNKR